MKVENTVQMAHIRSQNVVATFSSFWLQGFCYHILDCPFFCTHGFRLSTRVDFTSTLANEGEGQNGSLTVAENKPSVCEKAPGALREKVPTHWKPLKQSGAGGLPAERSRLNVRDR